LYCLFARAPTPTLFPYTTLFRSALVYLLKEHADILLLDVDMPLLDGFDVMKQVQHLVNPGNLSVPRLFVVLCSGFEVNPQDCFDHRAVYYIQKPLTAEKLIKAYIAIQEEIARLSIRKRDGKRKKRASTEGKADQDKAFSEQDL